MSKYSDKCPVLSFEVQLRSEDDFLGRENCLFIKIKRNVEALHLSLCSVCS